jgi:hypothetical protein
MNIICVNSLIKYFVAFNIMSLNKSRKEIDKENCVIINHDNKENCN